MRSVCGQGPRGCPDGNAEESHAKLDAAFDYAEKKVKREDPIGYRAKEREDAIEQNEVLVQKLGQTLGISAGVARGRE